MALHQCNACKRNESPPQISTAIASKQYSAWIIPNQKSACRSRSTYKQCSECTIIQLQCYMRKCKSNHKRHYTRKAIAAINYIEGMRQTTNGQ